MQIIIEEYGIHYTGLVNISNPKSRNDQDVTTVEPLCYGHNIGIENVAFREAVSLISERLHCTQRQ